MTHDKFAHEPECPTGKDWYEMCECETLRSAYRRGREEALERVRIVAFGNWWVKHEVTDTAIHELLAAARGDGERSE